MDRRHRSGAASSNSNWNNNSGDNNSKPHVPSKPNRLTGLKNPTTPTPFTKDIVTPKGWIPQQKFTFGQAESKDSRGSVGEQYGSKNADVMSTPKWRSVPKVTQKQRSINDTGSNVLPGKSDAQSTEGSTKDNEGKKLRGRTRFSAVEDEEIQRSVGSLKRIWNEKINDPDKQQGRNLKTSSLAAKDRQVTADGNRKVQPPENKDLTTNGTVHRSTSSSSDGSVRTASFKSKEATWHYVTANPSPSFSADALPSKVDLNESQTFSAPGKKFDHTILAPKPFQSSFDESGSGQRQRSNNSKLIKSKSRKSSSRVSRKSRQRKQEIYSESDSQSNSDENTEEAEMRIARKKGTLVTRYDSRGRKYKIDPRTGDIINADDDEEEKRKSTSRPAFTRMDAVSVEENPTGRSSSKQKTPGGPAPEEVPPPLLPREKATSRADSSVVPPSRGRMTKSVTPISMYSGRLSYNPPSPDYFSGGLSSETAVPPPLLPRGRPGDTEIAPDYTPMSGAEMEIPINDFGSSVSLNSYLDQSAYAPMQGKDDGRSDSFADENDTFTYSAAVNPAPINYRRSIREYHEIDPELEAAVWQKSPTGNAPPPPHSPPPSLAKNSVPDPYTIAHAPAVPNIPESPPPLPPMNHRKLNYIDVEFKSQQPGQSRDGRKSAKTSYSQVVMGKRSKDDTEVKRGKTLKEKLMAIVSSNKNPDGYTSEGDAITSKHNDDRTTDFSKERNKLKRMSNRILRKKKMKSQNRSRDSSEFEVSQTETSGENVSVGIYGSATNLSSTSSESSRSLSHQTSGQSGGSGDGQVMRGPNADRRQSHEPTATQLPPRLSQKSRSEAHLDATMSPARQTDYSFAASNPTANISGRKSSHDVTGSPAFNAPRVDSHLYKKQERPDRLPASTRPTSDPPGMDYLDMEGAEVEVIRKPENAISYRGHPSLDVIRDNDVAEKLSPNFPSGPPPLPPGSMRSPLPGPVAPPDPLRDTKPDRFKKRPRSQGPSYTAAENVRTNVDEVPDSGHDPIYDVVPNDQKPSTNLVVPISPAARSKLLDSEPLYQEYRRRTLSHASMRVRRNQSTKRTGASVKDDNAPAEHSDYGWQSDLMTDDAGTTTLWREVKEVMERGVGENLSNEEMKLQQAQFEVVTSQASYMRSLNILIDHFMNDAEMQDPTVLSKKQKKDLFSNIVDVRKIEQAFLQEIEQHFWSELRLTDIAKITAKYATADFEVYVRYVQNQVYQDRILTDLQRNNDRFAIELCRLESSPSCNKLPLLSFLLLPMQRVTRLPLLISAIVNQADAAGDTDARNSAKDALVVVNKLVKKCNEGARKMQQVEQLAEIAKDLKFASNVKTYALVSHSRSLVKKGEMNATIIVENRKPKSMKLYLLLFTDVLLLAKKKTFLDSVSGAKYEVIDWAKRAMLFVNERAVSESEIFLVLMENCNSKRVELTLSPMSINELSRWTDALSPKHASEFEDSIYESWDCPQYQCVEPYDAMQPDELTLDVGDIMRVLRKTRDDWLEGERLRDNESGWFPAKNCEEIDDEHVRARNLRNLYRIIPQGAEAAT